MNDPAFDTSSLGGFTVLGKKLLPLTLGHQMLLERYESGFALGSKRDPSYPNLIFSVFVCSRPFQEAAAALRSRAKLLFRMRLWGLLCGRINLPEVVSSFAAYLVEQKKEPGYWIEKEGDGGTSGAPFSQFLKIRLKDCFGMSDEEAMNTPYRVAMLDYLTHLEAQGIIRFYSDADRECIRMANDPEYGRKLQEWAERVAAQEKAKQAQ